MSALSSNSGQAPGGRSVDAQYVQTIMHAASIHSGQEKLSSKDAIKTITETGSGGLAITLKNGVQIETTKEVVNKLGDFLTSRASTNPPEIEAASAKFNPELANSEGQGIMSLLRELILLLAKQRADLQQKLTISKLNLMEAEYQEQQRMADAQLTSTIVKGVVSSAATVVSLGMHVKNARKMSGINQEIAADKKELRGVNKEIRDLKGTDQTWKNDPDKCEKINKLQDQADPLQDRIDMNETIHKNMWEDQKWSNLITEGLQTLGGSAAGVADNIATRIQADISLMQASRSLAESSCQYIVNQSNDAQKSIESSAAAYAQVLQQVARGRA